MTAPTKAELRAAFQEHTPLGILDPADWLLRVVDAVWDRTRDCESDDCPNKPPDTLAREEMIGTALEDLHREIPLLLERVLMPRMVAFANEHPEAPRAA